MSQYEENAGAEAPAKARARTPEQGRESRAEEKSATAENPCEQGPQPLRDWILRGLNDYGLLRHDGMQAPLSNAGLPNPRFTHVGPFLQNDAAHSCAIESAVPHLPTPKVGVT